jgi:hypothetical protein
MGDCELVMGLRIQRHLGEPIDLDPGQYTINMVTARPVLCCPACACCNEIDASYAISRTGEVTPAWRCPTNRCAFMEWLSLEAVSDE